MLRLIFCLRQRISHSPASLPLIFRKRSHSARLLGPKRPHNGSLSLTAFCGFELLPKILLASLLLPVGTRLNLDASLRSDSFYFGETQFSYFYLLSSLYLNLVESLDAQVVFEIFASFMISRSRLRWISVLSTLPTKLRSDTNLRSSNFFLLCVVLVF